MTKVTKAELDEGLALWAGIDAPWLAQLGRGALETACRPLRDLQPQRVLGSHLPPAEGLDDALYAGIETARRGAPFVGPDQSAAGRALEFDHVAFGIGDIDGRAHAFGAVA
jgi:hypothetical protein